MRAVVITTALAAGCSASDGELPPARRFPEQVARPVAGIVPGVVETAGTETPAMRAVRELPAIDMTGAVPQIRIKLTGVMRATTLELWLGSGGFRDAFVLPFTSKQGQRFTTEGEWVTFTLPWSLATTTGAPDRAAITDVAWRVSDDASGPVRLDIGGLALVPEPPHGIVSFTFDDNFASIVTDAAPILARHGFPATAYVIAETVGQPDRTTLDELHALQDAGWEIAAHAYSAAAHAAELQWLAAPELERELGAIRTWLHDHGFRGYDHLAYPHGGFANGATDVLPLVRSSFATARTIVRSREAWPPSDPSKLRVFYVTDVTPLADALAAIDRAAAHREWLVLVFHRLVAGAPARRTEWSTGDFAKLVEHVRGSGLPVMTMGQVVEAASHAGAAPHGAAVAPHGFR